MSPRRLYRTGVCALFVLAACGSGTKTPSKEASPTSASRDEVQTPSRCLPYPAAGAVELLTNADTGKQRVEGPIGKAAAVKSTARVDPNVILVAQRNKPLYFISVDLGGRIVTVVHSDIDNTGTPTGSGLTASVDAFSELATAFPYDDPPTPMAKALRASLDTDGAKESRACVR